MWLTIVSILLALFVVFGIASAGYLMGRTGELRRTNERREQDRQHAAHTVETIHDWLVSLPDFIEGDLRYDSRGWVYVWYEDDWQQLMITHKDGEDRWLHMDSCPMKFIKQLTPEEEYTLPHERAKRAAHEHLAK